MGPTASGKTSLAIDLCNLFPCDIVSVDSALIYRGMDIGTAKPSPEELQLAPHRLIDILEPAQSYSVAEFRNDALREMAEISARGRIPLLVGGTMMYYKALVDGLSPLPQSDESVRQGIDLEAQTHGWQALHQQLVEIDPISAQRIHPNDPQRLMRAIEVFRLTGKPMTELLQQKSAPIPYQVTQFAIAPEQRSVLHDRIALRFTQMLEQGFEQEVQALKARGDLHLDMPSMRCVGYRQMWQYLQGEVDFSQMVEQGIAATRQLAKRQLTWLRSWQDLNWLDTFDSKNLVKIQKITNI